MRLNYHKKPGPAPGLINASSTILQAFFFAFCFFMVEVWELPNTYASRTSAPSGWYDTSVEDMKAFIGMLTIIGISKLRTLEMNWSTNNSELVLPFPQVMPRSRFRQLLRFLHINSIDGSQVSTTPNYDRLSKVRKLLDIIASSHIYTTIRKSVLMKLYLFKGGWVSNNT